MKEFTMCHACHAVVRTAAKPGLLVGGLGGERQQALPPQVDYGP